jgi:hypothetical protein
VQRRSCGVLRIREIRPDDQSESKGNREPALGPAETPVHRQQHASPLSIC